MKSKRLPSLVILLILLATSCSTPPPSNQNGSSQGQNTNIEIQITGTETKELGTETIPQPNCTGNAEVENTVEKSRTIEYVMEVQNGASVNTNGQVGFAGTDIELGATVASQFGQSYGTSETLTRSITVKAMPSTDIQHIIRQVEIWKVGQAKISVGGQQTIIPFKYRYDFAIEYAGNNQTACDANGTTNIIPSNTQPSSETTETANWTIVFEYRFPSSFWTVGSHEYTIESECQNLEELNGSWTNAFNVSENVALLSGDVYLRLVGLREDQLPSTPIESINPLQTTTAAFTIIDATHSEAELAFTDCKVSIKWDGGTPKELTPGLPFER